MTLMDHKPEEIQVAALAGTTIPIGLGSNFGLAANVADIANPFGHKFEEGRSS